MNERVYALIFGIIFIGIGVGYYLYLLFVLKDGVRTTGSITDLRTAVPEKMKKNNSKRAVIRIHADGREYLSDWIQVPMDCNVGEKIDVKYEKSNPSNMVLKNRSKTSVILFAIGILCLLYGLFMRN